MRTTINPQLQFCEVDISEIEISVKSRDDIPPILRALQHIYVTQELREPVFALMEKHILSNIDKNNGRPGMELWRILVLGVLRLHLNIDYDRLQELANEHNTIRQMLGHGIFSNKEDYALQTLKDNVGLLSKELVDEINAIVIAHGHTLVKKNDNKALQGRCDSFVVETNVHYPTDCNLLFDAIRKAIQLCASLCEKHDLSHYRQFAYNIRQIKSAMRKAQQTRRSKQKAQAVENNDKQAIKKNIQAHQKYIDLCEFHLAKVTEIIAEIENSPKNVISSMTANIVTAATIDLVNKFQGHAVRQIDQITRRVMNNEIIPHDEKVFSIFEPHTQWISKGKAGVPVEFGLRVCIMEDQYGCILNHQIMEKTTDDKVAVSMVEGTQKNFPELNQVSFDKGFHSKENQENLSKILDTVILPRKGNPSAAVREYEHTKEFIAARHQHSAVESAINALEVHGLDICRDKGINHFKRYVSLAILARNLHIVGVGLHRKEQKKLARREARLRGSGEAIAA